MPMKRLLIVILMLLLLTIPKIGITEDSLVGQKFPVPSWQWVDTIPELGATCGIEFGSKLLVLAVENNTTLVQYQTTNRPRGATSCRHGIMFLIDTTKLKSFTSVYESIVETKKQREELINRLILIHEEGE